MKTLKKLLFLALIFPVPTIFSTNSENISASSACLTEFSPSIYNMLSTPEDAYEKVQKSNTFEQFLEEAKALAALYNIEEFMGIRLIHHHTVIKNNEIMVEGYEDFEGSRCLVTRPQMPTADATPASWIFDGNSYMVFEYSYDSKVRQAFEIVKDLPNFFSEFALLLQKYNYQKLVAIAILDRECYRDYEGEYTFLETSYNQPTFASIVKPYKAEDAQAIQGITTGWVLNEKPRTHSCVITIVCRWIEYMQSHEKAQSNHESQ